jgi:hypothetical protein
VSQYLYVIIPMHYKTLKRNQNRITKRSAVRWANERGENVNWTEKSKQIQRAGKA